MIFHINSLCLFDTATLDLIHHTKMVIHNPFSSSHPLHSLNALHLSHLYSHNYLIQQIHPLVWYNYNPTMMYIYLTALGSMPCHINHIFITTNYKFKSVYIRSPKPSNPFFVKHSGVSNLNRSASYSTSYPLIINLSKTSSSDLTGANNLHFLPRSECNKYQKSL